MLSAIPRYDSAADVHCPMTQTDKFRRETLASERWRERANTTSPAAKRKQVEVDTNALLARAEAEEVFRGVHELSRSQMTAPVKRYVTVRPLTAPDSGTLPALPRSLTRRSLPPPLLTSWDKILKSNTDIINRIMRSQWTARESEASFEAEQRARLRAQTRCGFGGGAATAGGGVVPRCRKKLFPASPHCACMVRFCDKHRQAEAHGCPFDYRGAGRSAIRKGLAGGGGQFNKWGNDSDRL